MSSSIWTLSFSDLLGDVPPLAILVTIIGIAIFMVNMFYTKNTLTEKRRPQCARG